MFLVIFEVNPKDHAWDTYLDNARLLRPELEKIDGFVDNIRYGSLTRPGWLVSLSNWRDEKSLIRWRTHALHHEVQAKGRSDILQDYHLRVGQIFRDTQLPANQSLPEQRLDETETGAATTITLIAATRPKAWVAATAPQDIARSLGLVEDGAGLMAWDVFNAVLTPGDVLLLTSWRDRAAAEAAAFVPADARLRQVRVIRDYGLSDRREAPQYYPEPASH